MRPSICILTLTLSVLSAVLTEPLTAEVKIPKIGILTDLSGPGASWGRQTRYGVDLAVAELRAQGVPVEIVYGDSGLDVKRGLSEAQKMLMIDGVDALLTEFSGVTNAVSPTVKGAKKLLVGSCAARKFLDQNPYAFKTFTEYEHGCAIVAQEWKKRGLKNIGMTKAAPEFGEWCLKGVRSVYPDVLVQEFAANESVATQLLVLKNKGVEAVMSTGYETDSLNLLKGLRDLNWKVQLGGCEPDLITEKTKTAYINELEGSISFGFLSPNKEFLDKLKVQDSNYDVFQAEGAAQNYLMLKEMARALRACPANDVDCQVREMEKTKGDALMGFEGFQNRIAVFKQAIFQVKNGMITEHVSAQ